VWIAAAIVAGVLVLGVAIGSNDAPATDVAGATGPDAPACVDVGSAMAYVQTAQDELTDGMTAAADFDIDGAADHVDDAADAFDAAASEFASYPAIAVPAASAARHMHASADDLRAYRIDEATSEMEAATSDIDTVTTATSSAVGDLVPC